MKVLYLAWWGVRVHVHVNKHGEVVVVGQNAENEAVAEEVVTPADSPIVVVAVVAGWVEVEEPKPVPNSRGGSLDYTCFK